ncbi:hypothetical protein P3X46_006464 [Hevea brasiliensis]|uniref:F-box domain-containing protein n=1 Tax=Hevea brasiliensis TaxID=3981 RepID=A0ABQ9MQS0_HEVBR|nr:F-box/kelch-repeat protein At3g06240-like [Hevea brasiliensis]KAJ9182471.1 hypothetical protein P3X46_006464 [Hevea brasiliensis]
MSKLPQDLIVEIFSRLPVKPLIRFKCLSKTWRSMISDPEFAKLQLNRAKENHNNFSCQKLLLSTWPPQSVDYEAFCDGNVRILSYPAIVKGPLDNFYVGILGSCNGLVYLLDDYGSMFLWNPTTGDYRELPNPNGAIYRMFRYGLGYNFSTDDYGVLFASQFTANDSKETIVELYTLKTGAWRRIKEIDAVSQSYGGYGIFWNGALYWLETKRSDLHQVYVIVAFDMVEEKFQEVLPLPDHFNSNCIVSLGASGNRLCIFCECRGTSFEALVLNVNGIEASLTRLFSFPHHKFPGYGNNALCLTENGEVLMDCDGWEIYLYNPKQGTMQRLQVMNYRDSESELYIESLVSPNN